MKTVMKTAMKTATERPPAAAGRVRSGALR
jgi:hypothetical protein